MKIGLKNIKHYPKLSDDSEAFSANLYINGKFAAEVSDDGNGGEISVSPINEAGKVLVHDAEAFCKAMPPVEIESLKGTEDSTVNMDLELYIAELLGRHLDQKYKEQFEKEIKKGTIDGVVYGIPGKSYNRLPYKYPIEAILSWPNGAELLKNSIVKNILPHLQGDVIILNRNIPESILKDAGLKESQYLGFEPVKDQLPAKKKGRRI